MRSCDIRVLMVILYIESTSSDSSFTVHSNKSAMYIGALNAGGPISKNLRINELIDLRAFTIA